MRPVATPGSTDLAAPFGMDDVKPLPVEFLDGEIVSRWEFEPGERNAILAGGTVELAVMGGAMPPVGLQARGPDDGRRFVLAYTIHYGGVYGDTYQVRVEGEPNDAADEAAALRALLRAVQYRLARLAAATS